MGGSVLLPNLHSLRASEEVEDCDHLLVPSAAAALPSIPSTDVRRAGCLSGVGSGGESGAVLARASIDVGEGEEEALEVFDGDEKLDAKLDPTDWASHGRLVTNAWGRPEGSELRLKGAVWPGMADKSERSGR